MKISKEKFPTIVYSGIFLLVFLLISCKEGTAYKPTYSKSHKAKNTLIMGCANRFYYQPVDQIVQYLNPKLKNTQFKIIAATDFENHLNRIKHGDYDINKSPGLEALDAQKYGYRIVGKFENDSTYYSVIFANKKSSIKEISDLKGKKLAYIGKGSLLGEMAPMVFLKNNGLEPYQDLNLAFYPSYETSILNVYLDKCDAGVAWATSWNKYTESHPEILKKTEIKWKTPKLLNVGLIIKNEVDPEVAEEILKLLLEMHHDQLGKRALQGLEFTQIIRADAQTYAPLKKLKEEFDRLPKYKAHNLPQEPDKEQ